MRLFLTRPEKDCLTSAKAFEEFGHQILTAPLLEIEYLSLQLDDVPKAIILTSRNGARSLEKHVLDKETPVYCIGDRTALEARRIGFKNTFTAKGGAEALETLILKKCEDKKGLIVHYSGKVVQGDLIGNLDKKGYIAKRVLSYKANKLKLSDTLIKALISRKIDGGAFYSARTGTTFSEQVIEQGLEEYIKPLTAYVMSDNIAEAIKSLPWKEIKISLMPFEGSLINLANEDDGVTI